MQSHADADSAYPRRWGTTFPGPPFYFQTELIVGYFLKLSRNLPSTVSSMDELPDLANKNIGCPCDIQDTLIIYLKFDRVACILSGNLIRGPLVGHLRTT